jgi:uncharacterized protein
VNNEFVFLSAQRRLVGRRFSPSGRQPSGAGILFIHGSGSDQSGYHQRATAASEGLGATCLTFDLSGHGESDGSRAAFTLRDHLDDSVAAFDTLVCSPEVDANRVGVCAASYGAYLAALLISWRPARSLLLRAPALYADHDLDLPGGILLSSTEAPATAASLRNLADYDGPVLILESECDETIPHAVVEAYLNVCRHTRHEVIPQAGHRLTDETWQAMFLDSLTRWFHETLVV